MPSFLLFVVPLLALVGAQSPDGFVPAAQSSLVVTFANTTQVNPAGVQLDQSAVRTQPSIRLADGSEPSTTFMQFIVDMDVPAQNGQKTTFLHLAQSNLKPGASTNGSSTGSGSTGSGSGSGSGSRSNSTTVRATLTTTVGTSRNPNQSTAQVNPTSARPNQSTARANSTSARSNKSSALLTVRSTARAPASTGTGSGSSGSSGSAPFSNGTSSLIEASYVSPSPPPGSGAHRYVVMLFAQPSNFSVPAQFADTLRAANSNPQARLGFDINAFASQAGLGAPLGGNFFLVQNNNNGNGGGNGTSSGSGGNGTATGSSQGANMSIIPLKGGAADHGVGEAGWSTGLVAALVGAAVVLFF